MAVSLSHITSYHITPSTPHHITPHHITSHHTPPHHTTPHHTKPHHTIHSTPHHTTNHINGTYDGTSTAYCLYWVRPLHLHSIMVCKHHCVYTCAYVRTTTPRVCQVKQAFALTSILARSSLADFSSLHFWIFFLMSCRARQWHLHTHTDNPQPSLTHTWHLHTHTHRQPTITTHSQMTFTHIHTHRQPTTATHSQMHEFTRNKKLLILH